MRTKTKLTSTTLTYLAGIGGAGPLPQEANQLSRHNKCPESPTTNSLWQYIKRQIDARRNQP